jgi:hypothetical protein
MDGRSVRLGEALTRVALVDVRRDDMDSEPGIVVCGHPPVDAEAA